MMKFMAGKDYCGADPELWDLSEDMEGGIRIL